MINEQHADLSRQERMFRYPWEDRVEPFRIFGNLYFAGTRDGSVHLLDTGDGLIVFDTNYPTAAALVIESIWELGFAPRDVRMILHTHGHYDHFGATSLLQKLSGCETYLGRADAEMFEKSPELALLSWGRYAYQELFCPDHLVDDGDVIRLGESAVRAVATPGHSPGAISYFFPVTDGRQTYVAGLHGGAGLNTLTDEFVALHHNRSWRQDYVNSLGRLRRERVDLYLGNHPPQSNTLEKRGRMETGDGRNPFINPTEWIASLDAMQDRFDELFGKSVD